MRVFKRYLTEVEERQLLSTVARFADVHARRDRAWMEALRVTGVRIQAFSRLTVFHAQEALRTGYLTLGSAIQKRGQAHTVRVPKRGQRAFRTLLAIRRELGYPMDPDAPLVLSRHHQALSVRSYQARMQHWCREAGLQVNASPHWFRHTLAKRIMARSTSPNPERLVQGALGHACVTSTAVYTWPDREEIDAAVDLAS
ncbi:MAG: tyrosine-type recombinase/integrase [Gammaproteobacteria bacterium]